MLSSATLEASLHGNGIFISSSLHGTICLTQMQLQRDKYRFKNELDRFLEDIIFLKKPIKNIIFLKKPIKNLT